MTLTDFRDFHHVGEIDDENYISYIYEADIPYRINRQIYVI